MSKSKHRSLLGTLKGNHEILAWIKISFNPHLEVELQQKVFENNSKHLHKQLRRMLRCFLLILRP